MTGDEVDVVRGYLDDATGFGAQVTTLTSSLVPNDSLGPGVAPSLLRAHESALTSVVQFVAAAEREVVELRAALEY